VDAEGCEPLGEDLPPLVEPGQLRARVGDLGVYVPQPHAILQRVSV
jgi:hypothetical protein